VSERWKDWINTVKCLDCLEGMKQMPDGCVDGIVTDPPYGLKFMGKEWDKGVPGVPFWLEALRVAKPGAHLLAFGGTRTFHRLACAIEDAGWEIRDTIMWVYGSGFPKSHDVSKAMREVVGKLAQPATPKHGTFNCSFDESRAVITFPATDAAKHWQGWGTALKPAVELICVARKPLEGTVAENVLKYGTGAMNIDGSRVTANNHLTGQRPCVILTEKKGEPSWEQGQNLCDSCAKRAGLNGRRSTPGTKDISAQSNAAPTLSEKGENIRADTSKPDIGCSAGQKQVEPETARTANSSLSMSESGAKPTVQSLPGIVSTTSTAMDSTTGLKTCASCGSAITSLCTSGSMANTPVGRWPSNLIHDGSEEVVRGFPTVKSGKMKQHIEGGSFNVYGKQYPREVETIGDSGSAARFFYCAKASKSERGGSTHPTVKPLRLMEYLVRLVSRDDQIILDMFAGSGSTLVACKELGRRFIGFEINEEDVKQCNGRLGHTGSLL